MRRTTTERKLTCLLLTQTDSLLLTLLKGAWTGKSCVCWSSKMIFLFHRASKQAMKMVMLCKLSVFFYHSNLWPSHVFLGGRQKKKKKRGARRGLRCMKDGGRACWAEMQRNSFHMALGYSAVLFLCKLQNQIIICIPARKKNKLIWRVGKKIVSCPACSAQFPPLLPPMLSPRTRSFSHEWLRRVEPTWAFYSHPIYILTLGPCQSHKG